MNCSNCHAATSRYRIVAHRLYRNSAGKVIAVENMVLCQDCLDKKQGGFDKVPIALSEVNNGTNAHRNDCQP